MSPNLLLPRQGPFECTKETCPATETIMGYAPNLTASIIFTVVFSLSTLLHIGQGFHYRTYSFLVAMLLGGICESVGSGGRILLSASHNPFGISAFQLQICLLTVGPAFYSAGIYLQLKHLVITFGAGVSRIRPAWYTYIFIACDLLSIALQGAGGGLSASAEGDQGLMDMGQGLMMAGLSFQVFTLLVFAGLCGEYFARVRRSTQELNPATRELRASRRFRYFLGALIVAFLAILFRCIYRIVEMAGGWGNHIMRDEYAFLVLDPAMCAVATLVLNAFHPGMCFENSRGSGPALAEKEVPSDSGEEVLV